MSLTTSQIMSKMISYFDGDLRRVNHALKVYAFARNIGVLENLPKDKMDILEWSALLHDIGIKNSEKKYNSSAGNYQEIEGPPVTREILKEYSLSKECVEAVCYIIGNHHTYAKIDSLEFQILVEADFLVNINEDNIGIQQIKTIMNKYFKTKTGTSICENLYKINMYTTDN